MLTDPSQQMASVGAIDPNAAQFLASAAQLLKQQACSGRVRDRGGGDDHGQQQAQGIDQQMSLASVDLFAAVVAPDARHLGRLDALAIQASRGRVLMTTSATAHLGSDRVMDALPAAILPPQAKVMVDTFPVRVVCGQHPPLCARDHNVQHRVNDLAHVQTTRSTAGFWRWNEILDTIPLAVGHIGRVCLVAHTPNIPNPMADRQPFQTVS